MRWTILALSLSLIVCSSFAQVTIQGTVTASYDESAALADALVQFFRLNINGTDTVRVALGSIRTDASGRFSYLLATDVEETQRNTPQKFSLTSSYPNPFGTTTQIGLSVPTPGSFTIAVYNILGQEVSRLEKVLTVGSYSVQWDGSAVPGVYFVVAKAGGEMSYIKVLQLQKNNGPSTLRLTGGSNAVQSKLAGAQSTAVASSVQVTVSKSLYQTYVSPVLAYAPQSLAVSLTYIGSGPVSAVKRDSAFKFTSTQFRNLTMSLPKADAAKAMADILKKHSAFEAAGSTPDGNAWARFTDGRLIIFVNNLRRADSSAPHGMQLGKSSPPKLNDAPPSNIPESKKVFLSLAFGSVFGNTTVNVRDLTEPVGYTGSWAYGVKGLKEIKDAGIFYATGHGGYGEVPTGGTEYAVWAGENVDDESDSLYADDLREHRLVYMYGLFDLPYNASTAQYDTTMFLRYAFTGQFVRKYMSFSKNSLVFMGACSSATNNVFVNSFFAKGASAYAGYTATAYSNLIEKSVDAFFDRTTGANKSSAVKPESPPQRSFDWASVLSWMQSNQLDYGSPDGAARLVVVPGSGSKLGPLAPSIASMFVHPYDQKLYIYGMFGENPGGDGEVTISGSPSQVMEWAYDGTSQMDRIVCKIPDQGAGSYGDVQVKVHGIKSNVSPLSRYKGEFKYIHETGDGRSFEAKLTLQFRVHMLGFRMKPGDKPIFNQTTYMVNADMGSKGECSASGFTGPLIWFGGANDMHNNIDGGSSQRGYEAGAWFDPEQKKVQVYMSGMAINGITQTDGSSTSSLNLVFGTDEFQGKRDNLPSYVEIPLAADFSIKKDSRSATKINSYFSAGKSDKVRIEWADITCEAPPKDDTAR